MANTMRLIGTARHNIVINDGTAHKKHINHNILLFKALSNKKHTNDISYCMRVSITVKIITK